MTSKPGRRYDVGDVVIWTDYSNGRPHRCEVLEHIEPDADDDYDLEANGPLYGVCLEADRRGGRQVAEVDLSPLPPPSLTLVGDDPDES